MDVRIPEALEQVNNTSFFSIWNLR